MPFTIPSSTLSSLETVYHDAYITSTPSMASLYEIEGIDPSSIGYNDAIIVKSIMSSIFKSTNDMTFTQYYIHTKNSDLIIKDRDHNISSMVSKKREDFLNNKNLYSSRIVYIPEIKMNGDLNSLTGYSFLNHLISSPFSKESRSFVKTVINERDSIKLYEEDLEKTYDTIQDAIQSQRSKMDLIGCDSEILGKRDSWNLIKAISNFDFGCIDNESYRTENLSDRLFKGEFKQVRLNGSEYFKVNNHRTTYIKFISIKGFYDEYLSPSAFVKGKRKPTDVEGQFIIMSRFRGLSRSQKSRHFKGIKDSIERDNMSSLDMFTGDSKSLIEQQMMMSEADKSVLAEVQKANATDDTYGEYESIIAVFAETPDEVDETSKKLSIALDEAGFDFVFETSGMDAALESFLPFSQSKNKRKVILNSHKAGALSLFYRAHEGLPTWDYITSQGTKKEEAFCVFESVDGSPFYYTPYIGGRAMAICVGPIRSGKTFAKNTLATHFAKFSGRYSAIDVDPGTEAIAQFFGDDGAIFRLDQEVKKGFNPFFVASGPDDNFFKSHFLRQVIAMVNTNTNQDLKRFTRDEELQVHSAINATLKLPKEMQSFKQFLNHCNDEVNLKLSRFHGEGMYASFYDNEKDSIGSLEKLISVYNIMGVKGDSVLQPLVMSEIVYRVIRTFEDPKIRDVLKLLDIDEAHAFLPMEGMAKFIATGIRTWGKWNASVNLWTQNPKELGDIEDWDALRSAASTFWFMADSNMNREVYKEVFNLSEGQLDAIQNLTPKKQAFIYQPDIGVSKVININVGPEQRVINTSIAGETMIYQRNIKELDGDIEAAINKTIKDLNFD